MHTTAAKWNEANHKINVFYFLQNPRMLNSIHASWERHLVSKNFDGTLYLDTKKNMFFGSNLIWTCLSTSFFSTTRHNFWLFSNDKLDLRWDRQSWLFCSSENVLKGILNLIFRYLEVESKTDIRSGQTNRWLIRGAILVIIWPRYPLDHNQGKTFLPWVRF